MKSLLFAVAFVFATMFSFASTTDVNNSLDLSENQVVLTESFDKVDDEVAVAKDIIIVIITDDTIIIIIIR